MNTRVIQIFFVLAVVGSLASCKKYLDINHDPNNAVTGDPKTLFSFAIASLASNRASGDLFIPMALAGQSQTSGGFSTGATSWGTDTEDQYVFTSGNFANIWTQFYTAVAGNLKKAIDLCENATPKNENGVAQAKVVLAETFYELTTTYGDIPFTEALDQSNIAPKFDDQQTVLEGCLTLLDEAINGFKPDNPFKFDDPDDMFYKGDIPKWQRLAKSLKLRVLMTMVDRDPSKAAQIGSLVNEGAMIAGPDDNFQMPFENVAGKRNPKYQVKADYTGDVDFLYASPYVLDYMNDRNDPRLPFFFDKPAGASSYHAVSAGANADDAVDAKIAYTLHSPTEPECIFSFQELLFYEAEIFQRGLGVTKDISRANQFYKQALAESAIYFGVEQSEAHNFAATIPDLTNATGLADINYQHWIDKFDRGIDAFIQWRRSGAEGSETPALTVPNGAHATKLFRRYQYPESVELSSNPNAPAMIPFTEKVWFDL